MNKLYKIIEYLFYIFVFLLPLQTRWLYNEGLLNNGHWEYGTFSLYATEILLGLIFLLVIILAGLQIKKNGSKLNMQKLDVLLISFLIFIGLSIIWSINSYISWQVWLVVIEAIALLYLASRIGWNYIKLGIAFVLSGLIQSVLAIYQFSVQSVFANKWLGMSEQMVGDGGVSVIEGAGRWLRAYGSLPHPNMLGGFLAIVLIILFGLLFHYRTKYYNPPWKISKGLILSAVFLFSSLVIITYGILLSFSRSAWLGLVIALIFLWIIFILQQDKKRLLFFFKLNIILLLVVVFFSVSYGNLLSNRVKVDSRLEAQSISERQTGYAEAVEIIKTNPFLGVGLGAYTQALYDKDNTLASYAYQPVHNVDLLVMAELGIIGWLILTITIIYLIYLGFRKLRTADNEFLMLMAAFLVILVIGFFDHYLWSLYFGLILSFLITGIYIKRLS
ncbi:MAG: O-antigen ligase family protein [Candidatus Komeilibacteria bacterium]